MTNSLDTGAESKEPATTLSQQYPDLKRLARGIRRSKGTFSLLFAECNLPLLRQQLSTELAQQLEFPPVTVKLSELNTDAESIDSIIAQQLTHCPDDAAVFLFDLEQLLPTLSREKLRSTVRLLNWRRSELSRLNRPLLIWLPRYAIDILAEETPDFYDWYSGIFSFSAQEEQRSQSGQAAFAGLWSDTGVHAAKHMNAEEKKKWLGTLKELLAEHQTPDKQRANLLNDLGYLLKSMGDNDKALHYYQQSLQIQQDIGDKAGEGATLNNISQVYHTRGDFDTALQYLQQSLQIRQDIGDVAGLCTTLFNMGHIHWENEEEQDAVSAWLTVYQLAKKMNLAQALEALENLAPQLGLEGGLAGWEALANQVDSQEST